MSEYTKPSVGAASCNYASLHGYNRGQGSHPPVPAGFTPGSMVPIFPTFGTVGYASLQHGQSQGSCSGYFNIQSAYGSGAANCGGTKYLHKVCGGN